MRREAVWRCSMNGRPDWWEAQDKLDAEHAEYANARIIQTMKRVTTYELSAADMRNANDVARADSSGLTVDRIVDRASRVADALGVELSAAQCNAILRDVNEAERTSSCGLDDGYECSLIVAGVLKSLRKEETVKVTPYVREYQVETVRKVKTLQKGGHR